MPDPISSSTGSARTCYEPELACGSTNESAVAEPSSCLKAADSQPLEANSTAASALATRYLRTDHSRLIALLPDATSGSGANTSRTHTWFASGHGPGLQFQPEVGASRTTANAVLDGVHFSGTLDFATAGLHAGVENDDASHGANLGAAATLVGAEITVEYHGYSFTFGESVSVGGGFSSGDRDVDGDGIRERCFKGSIGPLTFGFCDEL